MLEAAEDAQLEGAVTSKQAALAMVRERFGEPDAALAQSVSLAAVSD
jgi:hypothetical protein